MAALSVGQWADWPGLGWAEIVAMRRLGPLGDHRAEFVLRDREGIEHRQVWIGMAHLVPDQTEETSAWWRTLPPMP